VVPEAGARGLQDLESKAIILRAEGLTKHFGGLVAIDSIHLSFAREAVTGIIGPNGSGKTTLFNVITGYLRATEGQVFFEEENITALRAHQIVNRGIVRTFQVPQCCRGLTVSENIRLACLGRYDAKDLNVKVRKLAGMAGLEAFQDSQTESLPIGYLRRIEIAMAVATHPKIILLDEPFSGLTDVECEETSSLIKELSKSVTLVLIDHKLKHLMPLVKRVIVLEHGKVFFQGSPAEVAASPEVQRIYIGGEIG
jgi:branched-chain amino acid transport system ATP-binding protein